MEKYQTVDRISKLEKLLEIIKQSRSFKALVSSFEDGEELTGNLIELSFTRHYPKPSNEPIILPDGTITRTLEGGNVVGEPDEDIKKRVREISKRGDLVTEDGETYYE